MNTEEKYKKFVNTSFLKAVEPVVIEKARGSKYIDPAGTEYLDLFSGISVVNVGHCNPEVVQAAKAQLDKLLHCCSYVYYNMPMADLAEVISNLTARQAALEATLITTAQSFRMTLLDYL